MSAHDGTTEWLPPQLATLAAEAPAGDEWVHEIKYDGYRLLAHVRGARVRLMTRNRKDWTDRFPAVAKALAQLKLRDTVLDGELAVEVEGGITSFQALQNALRRPEAGSLQFFLFDVLRAEGDDVRRRPLVERKRLLRGLLGSAAATKGGLLRYSDHVEGRGAEFFRQACSHGLEGIISKRADAPYQGGRGASWLKVKCLREQEFVIGGYTDPSGSRTGLGALHVGAFEDGRLLYRGKVGTGFSDRLLVVLERRLTRLERRDSPFTDGPRGAAARGTHWVEPELVCRVRFTDITADGRLRHPSFDGLREDKPAREVTLELPADEAGRELSSGRSPAAKRSRTKRSSTVKKSSRTAGRGGSVQVEGVRLTSPTKVLYPEQGLTKLDLAEYYRDIADWILPHIRGRPLTLVRCPSGRGGSCFFQKHIDDSAPPALRRVTVEETDGPETYGAVDSAAGLISLVQLGALELHTFNVRSDQLEKPDRFVIDLDPDEGIGWDRIVEAAEHVRQILTELDLECFLKTTGGKGLHVVVPLVRRAEWEDVRQFSRAVASLLADAAPDRYTTDVSKKKRKGRVLLDYLRNSRGATAVEAYSTRARPGAPVATPIFWDELYDGVRPDSFTVSNIRERLASLSGDPWQDMATVRQSLTSAMRKKLGL